MESGTLSLELLQQRFEEMLDNDEISSAEEAFLRGYFEEEADNNVV